MIRPNNMIDREMFALDIVHPEIVHDFCTRENYQRDLFDCSQCISITVYPWCHLNSLKSDMS